MDREAQDMNGIIITAYLVPVITEALWKCQISNQWHFHEAVTFSIKSLLPAAKSSFPRLIVVPLGLGC